MYIYIYIYTYVYICIYIYIERVREAREIKYRTPSFGLIRERVDHVLGSAPHEECAETYEIDIGIYR